MYQISQLNVLHEYVPGHQSIGGNEKAHSLALNISTSSSLLWPEGYNLRDGHTSHCKCKLLHPHHKLNRPGLKYMVVTQHATHIRPILICPTSSLQSLIAGRGGSLPL